MAEIPCDECGQPAAGMLMLFGPEGLSQTYCYPHLIEFCSALVQGAAGNLEVADAGTAEAAPAAEAGSEANGTPATGKRRGRRHQEAPAETPEELPASAEIQGAEHPI